MIVSIGEVTRAIEQNYTGNSVSVSKLPQTKCDTFQATYQDGTERFVKVGKPFHEDRYAAQIAIAGVLSEKGLPIPSVIKTAREENYIPLGEGRFLEMHSWIPNDRPYQPTAQDIAAVAKAMAKMHTAADTIDNGHPAMKVLMAYPYTGMPPGQALPNAALLDEFERRLKEIPAVLYPAVARDLPLMREALVTEIPGKDWGIIHADLHGGQTMFDKDTGVLKGIIDWEWALYGPRARDLSFSLSTLAAEGKSSIESKGSLLSPSLVHTFIETYTASRPNFPREDLTAVAQHLGWDATCRKTRYITQVLKGVNEERLHQLVDWFEDKTFERTRELKTIVF